MRAGRRGRWKRAVPALAAAAVAAAALFPAVMLRAPQEASAAGVLRDLADVAARRPSTAATPGRYHYTRSRTGYLSTIGTAAAASVSGEKVPPSVGPPVAALIEKTREMWIAPDGSGRIAEQSAPPKFFSARDEERWREAAHGRLTPVPDINETFGPGELSAPDVSAYPTSVDALWERLRAEAEGRGPSLHGEMFVLVGDLLREAPAPPELRSALYRVAARLSGVELVGEVRDAEGRLGVAVARTSRDSGYLARRELVFEKRTAVLLAEREVLLERVDFVDAPEGAVIGGATYVRSAWVESVEERPGS